MTFFIITRLLDMITTLLNIKKYGNWEVEMNPFVRQIGNNGIYTFLAYQFGVMIFAILLVDRFKYKDLVFIPLSIITMVSVVINIYCLFL